MNPKPHARPLALADLKLQITGADIFSRHRFHGKKTPLNLMVCPICRFAASL
jgi:hypothetical protein